MGGTEWVVCLSLIHIYFVMLTLYGLMRQTLERLEEIIDETPALRQAFEKTNEWRKEETC